MPFSSPPTRADCWEHSRWGSRWGTRTVFVSCIDIGPQLKQPLEARQPLGLLAGQIEGTALMDLCRARGKKTTSKY